MGKVFDEIFGTKSLFYHRRPIHVTELNLDSSYLMRFCAYMENERNWVLDGITYGEIRSVRYLGCNKAKAIAEALADLGVEITDIPIAEEPIRLVYTGTDFIMECTNCHSRFNYCPMCGKKLKWDVGVNEYGSRHCDE